MGFEYADEKKRLVELLMGEAERLAKEPPLEGVSALPEVVHVLIELWKI